VNLFQLLEESTGVPWVLWSAFSASVLLLLTGTLVRARLATAQGGVVPDAGFSLRNVVEILVEMLAGLAEKNMGPKWRSYFPIIGTIFFFILISNLLGLVPGFAGATSSADTTWAWATISFVLHQYVGIREHGFGYINHFLGPKFEVRIFGRHLHLPLIVFPFALIEVISHLTRVATLSIRLLANMFADHTIVGVWLLLVPAVVPALFMGLGLLVAFLQAYVFAMLSMVYIGLALQEAH